MAVGLMLVLVVVIACALVWIGGLVAGALFGLLGLTVVLFVWRLAVIGSATQSWARALYGSDRDPVDDGTYSNMVERHTRRTFRARQRP
jgi:hypothetical protein